MTDDERERPPLSSILLAKLPKRSSAGRGADGLTDEERERRSAAQQEAAERAVREADAQAARAVEIEAATDAAVAALAAAGSPTHDRTRQAITAVGTDMP